MKVLYSHYLTEENHPAVQMVNQISRHLRDLGHEVHVHASAGLAEHAEGNGTLPSASPLARQNSIVSIFRKNVWFAKALGRNRQRFPGDRKAISEFNPDVVIARQDAYSWSVVKAALEIGLPCITYADAPVAYESRLFDSAVRWHPPRLVEAIERWVLRHSQAIITVSNPAANQLRRYSLDIPIHVNPNGVDAERFAAVDRANRASQRTELGLNTELVIGFQGTFKAFHGVERLRELILWSQDIPSVSWLLIGDGPERPTLQRDIGNCDNVVFLGRRHPEEMSRLLSMMDIAIAPHSQMEGEFYFCPLKILEYAASGCVVMASDQGDIPKLLDDGRAGIIVEDDGLTSWTAALSKILDDAALRHSISERAREHVLQNLTWRHTAERVDTVLRQVVAPAT